jgi:hypothetical protein
MHIDHHQRQNHLLELNLVDRPEPLHKMRRRIDMRAPLPHMSEDLREEARAHRALPLLKAVDRLPLLVRKTGPARNAGRKRVRQIDELFADEYLLDAREAGLIRVY